ncbi:hypothetical protein HMI56_000129, partial [Coelomomyces lativittatus]
MHALHVPLLDNMYSPCQFTSTYAELYAVWTAYAMDPSGTTLPIPTPPSTLSTTLTTTSLTHGLLRLSKPVEVQSAFLKMHAQFTYPGLHYFMYTWFFTTFVVGVSVFWLMPWILGW